jgi:hypothetical protein
MVKAKVLAGVPKSSQKVGRWTIQPEGSKGYEKPAAPEISAKFRLDAL